MDPYLIQNFLPNTTYEHNTTRSFAYFDFHQFDDKIEYNFSSKYIFNDPYDQKWLKLFLIFVYLICLASSLVFWSFVNFETQGLAGPHRTVINQMVSAYYSIVSTVTHLKILIMLKSTISNTDSTKINRPGYNLL